MKNKGLMNGLSLFTGYAGIDIALRDYVRPILYCEIEEYAQAIILSRMDDNCIPFAPIWNDVTTMDGSKLKGLVDIVYGGFPCQDISVAGKGAGLEGERSGLFREIIRICKEASPQFIFLENVPAIRTRGSIEVSEALAGIGYDCRWGVVSAAEIGANHRRERWFLLAKRRDVSNTYCTDVWIESGRSSRTNGQRKTLSGHDGPEEYMANTCSEGCERLEWSGEDSPEAIRWQACTDGATSECSDGSRVSGEVSDPDMQGQCRETTATQKEDTEGRGEDYWWTETSATNSDWWSAEPRVGRVANGVKNRAHRIKALGNGVVPLQVKTAFEKLMGITA